MPTFTGPAIRGSDSGDIIFANPAGAIEVTSFGTELTVNRNGAVLGYVPASSSKVFRHHWGEPDRMTVAGGEYSVELVNA